MFNLLFQSHVGPHMPEDGNQVADTGQTARHNPNNISHVYFRPETAQGAYINFANVMDTTRRKLPLGVGQVGKSFRNEVTVSNFIFRTREFEQMELQYFCNPADSAKWYVRKLL